MKPIAVVLWTILLPLLSFAQKPAVLDPAYEHTKWGISLSDKLFEFAACTTSFDTADDNDPDGDGDKAELEICASIKDLRLLCHWNCPHAARPRKGLDMG